MKLRNQSPLKAGWLVAAAMMVNVAAWAANIEYPGYVKVENFDNIAGDPVENMLAAAKYTNNQPDSITFRPSLFWPPADRANDYGSRITGFLTPPETADYVFFIASDNNSWLYLSTDSTPANLKLIAADQGWQSARTWTGGGGMDAGQTPPWRRGNRTTGEGPYENRSDTFLTSPLSNIVTTSGAQSWPTKDVNGNAVIHLVANQKYFLQYLFKEGGGGDNSGVAWKKATDPDPLNGDPEIMGTDGATYTNLSVIWPDVMTFQSQPASRTVQAGQTVNFTAVPLGVPGDSDTTLFTYKWFLNDVEITDGTGNAATYTILVVALADSGKKYKVEVTSFGSSPAGVLVATTTNATLTVIDDTVAPKIARIRSSDTFNSAKITFSEAVRNEAVTPGNYVFSGGLTVTDANFDMVVDFATDTDPKNPINPSNRLAVVLFTSAQTEGATYSLTVNNVKDQIGNNLSPNTATMYANVFRGGVLRYKRFNGGSDLPALEANQLRLASPTLEETLTLAERGSPNLGFRYVGLISGFFIPPVTTNYVFFTSQDADNSAIIYLSTDASPVNRKLICYDPGWQNARIWTGPGGDAASRRGVGDGTGPFENRSDELLTSARAINGTGPLAGLLPGGDGLDPEPWPVVDVNGNAFITLTGGVRYAFQQWQPENDGGQMSATYKYVGPNNTTNGSEADPVNGTISRLTGNVIGAYVDPSGLLPVISVQPTNVTFTVGGTINFSVTASSAVAATNQWFKNEVAIAGQTGNTLTINNATASDMGSYHVTVANENGTVTSTRVTALTTFAAPGLTFQQDGAGLTVIEAEHYFAGTTAPDGHLWVPVNTRAGSSGSSYLQALPDSGINRNNGNEFITNSARLDFRIAFAASGTNYLWLRAGDARNDGAGDSAFAGFQGSTNAAAAQFASNPNFQTATWNWSGTNSGGAKVTVVVPSAGTYNVSVWMREDGFLLDKVLLTTDVAFVPTGTGPAESAQVGTGPTLAIGRNGANVVITYTGTLLSAPTVNGTYTAVAGASGGSHTVSPTNSQQFFRAQQ